MAKLKKLKDNFSKNLKQARAAQKITQQELARKANMSDRYISQIERNSENVALDTVDALANALGKTQAEMLLEPDFIAKIKKETIQLAIEILKATKENIK